MRSITINAAHQYVEEDSKGTIEVGRLADLVILSDTPLTIPEDEIKNIEVRETVKAASPSTEHPRPRTRPRQHDRHPSTPPLAPVANRPPASPRQRYGRDLPLTGRLAELDDEYDVLTPGRRGTPDRWSACPRRGACGRSGRPRPPGAWPTA
ncbi:amidohydrolase family protein [Streptomyces sp. 840.1]|uniref:amidohydrolase family protein n=1 Tax=Streptomyces sp. 840.1 TaxID=2485152 RepID=UPI000F46C907|nr:amidohydrolase family protein [Streptomyces sp. 840.1]